MNFKRVGVLMSELSLADREKNAEFFTGPGRVPRLSCPFRSFAARVQGVHVLRTGDQFPNGNQFPQHVSRERGIAG